MKGISITREESTALKGFFMLFIVLGHTKGIVSNDMLIYFWVYSFHVTAYFILPWIYPHKHRPLKKYIPQICFRLIIPYTFFYILAYLFYHLTGDKPWSGFLNAFFAIRHQTIADNIGLQSMWFIPVFLVFMVMTQIFRNSIKDKIIPHLLLLLISVTIFIAYIYTYSYEDYKPLACIWAFRLSFYFSCAILSLILLQQSNHQKVIFILAAVVFIAFTIIYFVDYQKYNRSPIKIIMSVTAFIIAFRYKDKLATKKVLLEIGKYSLPIYLIHVFIIKLCEQLIGKSLHSGILTYFIAIGGAYFISKWVSEHSSIRQLIFPASIEDFKRVFTRK